MIVKNLAEKYDFKLISGNENLNREIKSIFCCDLLSLAMGRAKADCCWLTVMGNINSLAVATLADIACIILCEGVKLDEQCIKKAQEENIPVLYSDEPIYETAMKISNEIGK